MAKSDKTTTTIRISESLKNRLDALGSKTDTYEIILKRLLCLHELVMERDSTLIDEARRRAESSSPTSGNHRIQRQRPGLQSEE